jgi:uncharacterized 2Fe-2S/4Fe-4S cluster protein (DUF4445 family)
MTHTVRVTIVDAPGAKTGRTINVTAGTMLLQAALDAGVDIVATCGRRGRCRSCRVKVLRGDVPPPTVQDTIQLGHEGIAERFRLSCQTAAIADCTIVAAPAKGEAGYQILGTGDEVALSGMTLGSGVTRHAIRAAAPGDENHLTSDVEEILARLPPDTTRDIPLEVLRKIPTALRAENGRLTVTRFLGRVVDVEAGDAPERMYGMAFDIGTTSVVGSLIDLGSGELLASVGGLNPQAVYGGDLMSRVAYAQFDPRKLATLRGRILTEINDYIDKACTQAKVSPDNVYKVVIVGNTCMHHIFLGIDTSYVGLAPYAPVARAALMVPAAEIPLKKAPNAHVCLLPIVAGFVGADTIAAILATRLYDGGDFRVLVDIGTNGEVVMGRNGRLFACSAPAGPTFEGGQITHGMRGAAGAIEKVEIGSDVVCRTIGDAPAIGICGSGLIDAVAAMLDAKVLDGAGRLRHADRDGLPPPLRRRLVERKDGRAFVMVPAAEAGKSEDIVLTQMDIRQLQLAKAAIYAGIAMLQRLMAVADQDIAELLLAGGFGNYVNIANAVRIRLLPALPVERIRYVGNAAHVGAQMALLSETERRRAESIAREIKHVALATRPEFQDIFVDACNLTSDGLSPGRTGGARG